MNGLWINDYGFFVMEIPFSKGLIKENTIRILSPNGLNNYISYYETSFIYSITYNHSVYSYQLYCSIPYANEFKCYIADNLYFMRGIINL